MPQNGLCRFSDPTVFVGFLGFCFGFTLCGSDIADVFWLSMIICETNSLKVICAGGDDYYS